MIPHILGSKPVVEAMEADLKPRVELLRQQGIVPKLAVVAALARTLTILATSAWLSSGPNRSILQCRCSTTPKTLTLNW